MKTYLTKTERAKLIDEYMACWMETESYDGCETYDCTPEQAAAQMRSQLESMNNSELAAEIEASGWI